MTGVSIYLHRKEKLYDKNLARRRYWHDTDMRLKVRCKKSHPLIKYNINALITRLNKINILNKSNYIIN